MSSGIFIVFEGIDGAGKTTQIKRLKTHLEQLGLDVIASREPTDGPWGRLIRQSAESGRLPLEQEIDAFINDRKEHLEQLIRPALAQGTVVLLDRYFYSTIAYQGARGADPKQLEQKMRAFADEPDVVIVLDIDPRGSQSRINERDGKPNEFERMEDLTRIRQIFKQLIASDNKLIEINGERAADDVEKDILQTLINGVFKTKLPTEKWNEIKQ